MVAVAPFHLPSASAATPFAGWRFTAVIGTRSVFGRGQDDVLKLKPNMSVQRKGDSGDPEHSMVAGVRRSTLTVSESADLLRLSHSRL